MRNSSIKKISRYGVAAAAVLGSSSAKADVVYFNVDPPQTSFSTNNQAVLLSFSLEGAVATDGSHVANEQFFATHTYGPTPKSGHSSKLNFRATVGTTAFNGNPLPYGTVIGPSGTNTTSTSRFLVGTGKFPPAWTAGQEAFIGLQFNNSGATNYGWADITAVSATSITMHGFAYDNTGESIAAGDINPIPEPTQIALFAIGAAGVAFYRHRSISVAVSR